MGKSKSYKGGPGWQGPYTNPSYSASKGSKTTADGASPMSGSDYAMDKSSGQNKNKSKSGSKKVSSKPYGMS